MHKTWDEAEKDYAKLIRNESLASEIVAWSYKVAKSKDFAILCLTIVIIILALMKGRKGNA